MSRRLLWLCICLAGLSPAVPAFAQGSPAPQRGGATVDIVKLSGVLGPALTGYVRDALRDAEARGSTVVLQVDSPGGYAEQAGALARDIERSTVPVVAWIGPIGARAQGGALLVAYACGLVAMAPGAGIGPAVPFDVDTTASAEDPAEVGRLGHELQADASRGGLRPEAVRELIAGRALAAGPALQKGAVSVVAPDVARLLEEIDGRTVRTGRGSVTLATVSRPGREVGVRFIAPGPIDRLLHTVSSPSSVYVLVVLGLWGIAFELTQPGLGVAGIAGVLALLAAAYGLTVVPVHWVGFAMLLAGMGLQALDVVLRRVAWLTLAGTALFATGSALAWRGVAPSVELAWWLVALLTVGGALYFGFGLTVALRSREQVRTAQVGLIGLLGEVRSDLNPEGGVVVKGTVWRARAADGHLPKGSRVRVKRIDGLVLVVEHEPE